MTKKIEAELNRVISKSDRLWTDIKKYEDEIVDFLSENMITDNTIKILLISLKLVISELILNQKEYEIKDYTFEEFTKLIDEYSVPDIDDKIKMEIFIKEVRGNIWGFIKKYYKELTDLLLSIKLEEKNKRLTKEECSFLSACLCIVFVEIEFRETELYFLEN